MAIAFDAATNHAGAAGSATDSFSHTVGAGANRLLVVGVEVADTGNTVTVSSITFNSKNLTFINRVNNGSGNRSLELWYMVNPDSGAFTVSVTLSAAPASWMDNFASSYTGVKQSAQPDSSNTGNGGTGGLTVSTTTVADNSWIVGLAVDDSASTITAGANTTQRLQGTQDSAGARFFDTNAAQTPAGSHSLAFTSNGASAFCVMPVASFSPSGAAAAALPYRALLGVGI